MARPTKPKHRKTYIREWRKHRGLNQEQLAARVETTQETISRLERGEIAYTQPMLEAVAEALNCGPADLIMRDPSKEDFLWTIWDQIPAGTRSRWRPAPSWST
jgi:transcriptional regulator with XRE-family HTH domain